MLWLAAHRREGHAAGCADTCVEILRQRGLAVSERLAARIAGADPSAVVAAALVCRDEEDLLARLDAGRRAGRRDR